MSHMYIALNKSQIVLILFKYVFTNIFIYFPHLCTFAFTTNNVTLHNRMQIPVSVLIRSGRVCASKNLIKNII
jgi:hypothetical protein